MTEEREKRSEVAPEQLVYANLLLYGCWIAIGLLVAAFILYITGVLSPLVPVTVMPKLWHLKVHEFVETLQVPTGWGWLNYVGKGDYLNFIGIALLASLTIFGYLILLPAYMKRKDAAFSLIVLTEICVLLLAASGILKGGGH
ncbi:MAG: DUF1634 domain-containing protein [Desulfotomaculales bacterium]